MTASTEPTAATPTDPAADGLRPRRHPLVRIPAAILLAFVTASIVVTVWAYVLGPLLPDAVDNLIGVVLLFAAAPILTAVFLRGSRSWVRVAIGIASTFIWVYWLFLVLIPITS